MKLDALVRKSLPARRMNAAMVKVVQYKTGRDKDGFAVAMARTYSTREVNVMRRVVPAKDRSKYVSAVRFIDKKLNVHVACSCPDFLFRWEYALAQAGAAVIHYSNGEPPLVTNPGMRPSLCIAKNTLVTTTRGEVAIQRVAVGDSVLTLDGWCTVEASNLTGRRPVTEIVTQRGHRLRATSDHKVLAYAGDKLGWFDAGTLRGGDTLFQLVPPLPAASVKSSLRRWARSVKIAHPQLTLLEKLLQPGVTAHRIVSTNLRKETDVYDLTVAGAEHFTANGFVVHNCKHLVALRQLIKKKHNI